MNAVHAVLRNWDILRIIINFVKPEEDFSWHSGYRDLVAIALVCHALSDIALDVAWRVTDMCRIISLFPTDIIRVDHRRSKSLTRIPTAPPEWERFDAYACRVRELSASPWFHDLFLLGVQMRYHTSHYPFPNLTCLKWESAPSHVFHARTLICPTLAEVQLVMSIDKWDEDEKEDDDAVAEVLRSLGETCPRLRKFKYIHYSTPTSRSRVVETCLVYLVRQCRRLENVHLPVSRNILRALGRLPDLSRLLLEHVAWQDGSQIPLPPQAGETIEADSFPVLDDLILQYWHTVSYLKDCFQGSGCFPRKRFTMWEISNPDEWSTPAIAEFLRGILRPDRSEMLPGVRIVRRTALQNPPVDDPWQPLWCLSSLPNIRSLWLEGLFLDINDADLGEISRILPELRYLRLNVPYANDYKSQISFQGLAHLSTLENLKSVSLMLAPESTISESLLSPSTLSNSRLKYLTINGHFPPVAPHAVVRFLILHFPRLEWIDGSLYLAKQERDRMHEIQDLWDISRQTMENVRTGIEKEGGEN